ncbi:hypothetical protein [Pseudoflavonifractor sp. 60]|nr:hypothetical protein [Pseudoflavonifractor sp. 60]
MWKKQMWKAICFLAGVAILMYLSTKTVDRPAGPRAVNCFG